TNPVDSTKWVNSQLLVIPMIEDVEAVGNLDDILKISGPDVFHVAASDLGQSMGNPGRDEVRKLMGSVIPRIRSAGINVGVGGNSPSDAEGVAEFIKLGANFVTVSATGLLRLGAEDFRKRVDLALS
ncbi:MAG: aldolase/citrate lyase family protein, partial [Chloroflexota bacterium]|nr:aldolase/citrate lyase family protein [Chloroflexota bacterium]